MSGSGVTTGFYAHAAMAFDDALNPTQRATLAALGAGDPDARAAFEPGLAGELRARLETGLAAVAGELGEDRTITVTKHLLNGVHGCQARYLHEQARPFEPSVPIVKGTIAHKALELAVHWPGVPLPLELVDEAIDRVGSTDHWATDFVATMTPAERAELRASAAEIVNKFVESWPPLVPAMRPATEAKMWAELCGGRIVLKGQADLTLGQPVGSGMQARKIIVDHKTGGRTPEHRFDLRFYALVETLRLGVPPRLVVTAYLNTATLETEVITADILTATAARVIDGVDAEVALRTGAIEAVRRPSGACRWCALLDECEVGQSFLADR